MNEQQLDDLEQIRQLKSRYFRFADTQEWSNWKECFTADISAVYEGCPRTTKDSPVDISCEGRDALVDGIRVLLTGAKSAHQGFMPEIELLDADHARAIWPMFDYVRLPTCHFKGWGHYHERYIKEGGAWRIKKIHLTRLHTEEIWI
jgi:3-phenylpropionate/cinnamic acid dioxygenase small subunit